MKFILFLLFVFLVSPAFACESDSNCQLGDALVQLEEELFLVECVKYNSSHDKWEVTKGDKEYLISPENSKIWTMDGEIRKEVKNGKIVIKVIPTFSYYIVCKDMSESPVGVDEIGVSKDYIVAYNLNAKGDRFKTIYSTLDYEVITSDGVKIKNK